MIQCHQEKDARPLRCEFSYECKTMEHIKCFTRNVMWT